MTHTALPPRLSATQSLPDHCDRCGAPARLLLTLSGGGDLSFCGHHANEHSARIVDLAGCVLVEEGFAWKGSSALC
jgi:hypothetical protein